MTTVPNTPIRADWKVHDVLKRYPALLPVLIDVSPAFGHLRNPLARSVRTRLVSVAQAARVAAIEPSELVRHLNEAAGLEPSNVTVVPQSLAEDDVRSAEACAPDVPITEQLDIRPLLERGDEPFKAIMAAAARVPHRGALRLQSSFEPLPLYEVLARRGFSHSSVQLGGDEWEITFWRTGVEELPGPCCARAQCQPAPTGTAEVPDDEDTIRLDVSDLVPPEPMVRILEAASRLQPGQMLEVEHHRRPVYLYPQLDAQGFMHETDELGPGRVQIRIRRA